MISTLKWVEQELSSQIQLGRGRIFTEITLDCPQKRAFASASMIFGAIDILL